MDTVLTLDYANWIKLFDRLVDDLYERKIKMHAEVRLTFLKVYGFASSNNQTSQSSYDMMYSLTFNSSQDKLMFILKYV